MKGEKERGMKIGRQGLSLLLSNGPWINQRSLDIKREDIRNIWFFIRNLD